MSLARLFKAYDVRATYPQPLNEDAAWRIGFAAGQFLERQGAGARSPAVLLSRDMRPHSPALCAALGEGIRAAAVDVIDLGMCDTSFQYFAINHLGALGGIQTTASHNPIAYNGFKISGLGARPIGADTGLKEIREQADAAPPARSVKATGRHEERDLWAAYRTHVLKFLGPRRRRLKVVIDASNAMAGKLVPQVFAGVADLEIIPLNFEITGSFAHEPNPLIAANMVPTQEAVRRHHADLGACFDGDADRCMLTDEQGTIIGCDHLTAMLCGHFLPQAPGAAVVYDLRSSKAVEEEIRRLGGVPRRSRVGHVFMKALLRESQGIFGGELSGHFYFRDNFCCDSGAIALASVLSVLGNTDRPLSALIAPFTRYAQSGEINFQTQDPAGVMAGLRERYAYAAVDQLDGVTIDAWAPDPTRNPPPGAVAGHGWWLNVRASNTEPLLRLNAEARNAAALQRLLADVKPLLGREVHGH